ncbi:MAG: iron-sulfur cluster assembly scaffold protein [Desulfobacteraceae bacterium]|nr:iron-sulfur cluster assembly scaffold protein [Desulfobacteraceae bacterium]
MTDEPSKTINDFWQEHSLHFLEMAFRTDRQEVIRNPDGFGEKQGDCGDTVAFYLKLDADRISSVSIQTNGCLNTNACANTVAHLVEGRTIDEAWEITPEQVADFLETLPDGHFHCAELAVGALYLTLSNVKDLARSPWKKMYPHTNG